MGRAFCEAHHIFWDEQGSIEEGVTHAFRFSVYSALFMNFDWCFSTKKRVEKIQEGNEGGFATAKERLAMTFHLTSPAFESGADIPKEFTCDGADSSPSLIWTDPPPGTETLALIVDDPDAPSGT